MLKPRFAIFALGFALAAAAGTSATAGEPAAEARGADFRGAPPFKRHAKVAPRPATVVAASAVRASGVAVRGRPPFRRNLAVPAPADTVVFARLEETEQAPRRVRRSGPPGKRAPFVSR